MDSLIKINTNENAEPVVSGRELHERLGLRQSIKIGFQECVSMDLLKILII